MELSEEFFYAQIDSNGTVVAVSHLSGPVDAPNMGRIKSLDAAKCGQAFDAKTGVFTDPEVPAPTEQTHISVGAFFDRFGASKYAILSSPNPMVKALVKDASVRTKEGVSLTSPTLLAGLNLLQNLGFEMDVKAVIDAPIQPREMP
jgi:hypothetical protein